MHLIQFRIRHRWVQRVLWERNTMMNLISIYLLIIISSYMYIINSLILCFYVGARASLLCIFYANQYLNIVITTSWSNHKKNSKIYYQWNHLWIFQLQQRSHPNGIRLLQHYGTWLVEKIDSKNNCLYKHVCVVLLCSPTTIYSIDISCLYEWLGELEFVGWF